MPSGRTQLIVDNSLVLNLGTLGSKAAIQLNTKIDGSRRQGCKISKVKASFNWKAKTNDEGPILVGLAANLSQTEVAEMLTADPQQYEDPGASEEGNRRVFPIWVIPKKGADQWQSTFANQDALGYRMADVGLPSWTLNEDEALTWWAFNADSAALTTGTRLEFTDIIVTTWERD